VNVEQFAQPSRNAEIVAFCGTRHNNHTLQWFAIRFELAEQFEGDVVDGDLTIVERCSQSDNVIWPGNGSNRGDPIFLLTLAVVVDVGEGKNILDVECLLASEVVPKNMRLEFSPEELPINQELESGQGGLLQQICD
jgi:hypothetical protein